MAGCWYYIICPRMRKSLKEDPAERESPQTFIFSRDHLLKISISLEIIKGPLWGGAWSTFIFFQDHLLKITIYLEIIQGQLWGGAWSTQQLNYFPRRQGFLPRQYQPKLFGQSPFRVFVFFIYRIQSLQLTKSPANTIWAKIIWSPIRWVHFFVYAVRV